MAYYPDGVRGLPFLTDVQGRQVTLFGRSFKDVTPMYQFLDGYINFTINSELRFQPSNPPIHKNYISQEIIRNIIYKVANETERKYYTEEADYADKKPARKVPVSHITDDLLFKHLMEYSSSYTENGYIETRIAKYLAEYLYTPYAHRVLKKYDNQVIVFIKPEDQKQHHRVLEDCGFKINIDYDYANPLIISYDKVGFIIPEDQLNFLRLCMGKAVIETMDADVLKFVGTSVFYDIPRDRNDLDERNFFYEGP